MISEGEKKAVAKAVRGLGEATADAINAANESRDERIIKWVVNNIPGASQYEARLRKYME